MKTTEIEPALSAEEWEYELRHMAENRGTAIVRLIELFGGRPDAVLALANAALPDSDPRKITRGKIAEMKACSDEADSQTLYEIALALESYLPPA